MTVTYPAIDIDILCGGECGRPISKGQPYSEQLEGNRDGDDVVVLVCVYCG